jgi:predicted acetyltransferase
MTIEIRTTRPEEYRAAADAFHAALLTPAMTDEQWEQRLASWDECSSISAWDDQMCVGHAAQFPVETTVPGGARLTTGAVSRVGVVSTHRRQRVATGLMEALVGDASDRGFAMMSLRASEAVIYRRYGFGIAGEFCTVEIKPAGAHPIAGAVSTGSFRTVPASDLLDVIPSLYERVAHRRPGVITRPRSWWHRYLSDAIDQSKASFAVVHIDPSGEADGYVHYDVEWNENTSDASTGVGEIHDIWGSTDGVELALWEFVLSVDLVVTWKADERPSDDLLRSALRNPRAYAYKAIDDEQWLRLTDVESALRVRRYNPTDRTVTIRVSDSILGHNNGTWRIDAGGASMTDVEPDLVTDIAGLSAAYLGGTGWWALAATGAVESRRAEAAYDADLLFASRPLPFCGSFF